MRQLLLVAVVVSWASARQIPKQLTNIILFHQTERHTYEKCQYDEFKKRVAKMDELRAAKGGERSN